MQQNEMLEKITSDCRQGMRSPNAERLPWQIEDCHGANSACLEHPSFKVWGALKNLHCEVAQSTFMLRYGPSQRAYYLFIHLFSSESVRKQLGSGNIQLAIRTREEAAPSPPPFNCSSSV